MELLNNECLHRILGMSFHGTEKLEIIIVLCCACSYSFIPHFLSFYFTTQTNMGLNNWKCLYAIFESAYEFILLAKELGFEFVVTEPKDDMK